MVKEKSEFNQCEKYFIPLEFDVTNEDAIRIANYADGDVVPGLGIYSGYNIGDCVPLPEGSVDDCPNGFILGDCTGDGFVTIDDYDLDNPISDTIKKRILKPFKIDDIESYILITELKNTNSDDDIHSFTGSISIGSGDFGVIKGGSF